MSHVAAGVRRTCRIEGVGPEVVPRVFFEKSRTGLPFGRCKGSADLPEKRGLDHG